MRKFFSVIISIIILSTLFGTFWSCEEENLEVGSGIVGNGAIPSSSIIDLVSYNTNVDSIRSDENVLQNGILGVYNEPVFGRTKANFYSQVRLLTLSPDFSNTNTRVDSVILNIPTFVNNKPERVDTVFLFQAPEDSDEADTLLILTRYVVDSIYGNRNLDMTLNIREVEEFLLNRDTIFYSNPLLRPQDDIAVSSNIIGSVSVSNAVTTETVKVSNVPTNIFTETPGYKAYLNNDFFEQKIIEASAADLSDQASFIRNVIQGLQFSVEEDNGFLFAFNPGNIEFTMHYSFENPDDVNQDGLSDSFTNDNGDPLLVEKRLSSRVIFQLTSFYSNGFNVQVNQYENNRIGTPFESALNTSNPSSGDSRLYMNGLDGTRSVITLDQNQLNEFKIQAEENEWAILSAQLKFYLDQSIELPIPEYISAWHQYTNENGEVQTEYFDDLRQFPNNYPNNVQFNRRYDFEEDPGFFQINITEHIKDIVEQDSIFNNSKIMVGMGNFLLTNFSTQSGTILFPNNPFFTNRSFNPYRSVFHGNATDDVNKKLQLQIFYTKPQN